MDNSLIIWWVLALGLVNWSAEHMLPDKPLFLSMEKEWEQVTGKQLIGTFRNPDTLLEHELFLLTGAEEQPLLFYSEILTPVCIDNICKPVEIALYWNLVGNYAGYGIFEESPLTKFDHDEFLAEDYKKLNGLLSDNKSVFKRKTLKELFDEDAVPEKQVTYQGVEVDAVSGATKKEIKESVVEGALYSCYTLWHLVHGAVTFKIEDYLQSIYSPEVERSLLYAEYQDYQFYALKQMEASDYRKELPRISTIFTTAQPLIRTYLLKKLPKDAWQEQTLSKQLYAAFPSVDINSRTLLIENLAYAHPIAPQLLAEQIEAMSKNQLKTYLKFLVEDRSVITPVMQEHLQRAAESETYAYGYLITQLLE